jgi:hypothetical protein
MLSPPTHLPYISQADVGTLSNNIERKFGLSALADKLLFIGPEIKADIQLEQAEFQSIVSGETVQVRGMPGRVQGSSGAPDRHFSLTRPGCRGCPVGHGGISFP